MKALKPSMREKKRYLLVKGENLKLNIEKAILDFVGVLGMSKTGLSWIESKSDEQMIIFLEFKTPVNLKCINFETKGDESSPKILKFFINKLNLDFENIERTKEVDIKVLENEEKIQIALKTVKFKKVSNFTVKCFFLFL